MELKIIARMKCGFPTKFGLPRQSSIVSDLTGYVVMEKPYAVKEAFRGLEGFSHLFLLWGFSENKTDGWSPTVRPPRLGGNRRVGVFASRSPFRPNPIGLSCVRLLGIEEKNGTVFLKVAGADLMDGTPIYDIKPYLPFTDAHPDAAGGYAAEQNGDRLSFSDPDGLLNTVPEPLRPPLISLLRGDPRPGYHHDPGRVYGFRYEGYEIRFRVNESVLTLCEITEETPLA